MDHVMPLLRLIPFLGLLYAVRRPLGRAIRVVSRGVVKVARPFLPLIGGLLRTIGKELLVDGSSALLGIPSSKESTGSRSTSSISEKVIGAATQQGSFVRVLDQKGSHLYTLPASGASVVSYSSTGVVLQRGPFMTMYDVRGQSVKTWTA